MGQSEVLVGTCWAIHWELDGNMLGTKKLQQNSIATNCPHTLLKIEKDYLVPLGVWWLTSLVAQRISMPIGVLYHFWPRLMAGVELWGHSPSFEKLAIFKPWIIILPKFSTSFKVKVLHKVPKPKKKTYNLSYWPSTQKQASQAWDSKSSNSSYGHI
jgi:hypothetical protein